MQTREKHSRKQYTEFPLNDYNNESYFAQYLASQALPTF
jgi:hypothetical protein